MALFWQSPVGCLPHSEHKLHWLPFSWVARTVNSLLSCQIQAAAVTCCKSLTWNKLAQSVQGSCQQGEKMLLVWLHAADFMLGQVSLVLP